MNDKNSAPKRIRRPAILQNTKIKNKTEWTAFFSVITINAEINAKLENKRNIKKSIFIFYH